MADDAYISDWVKPSIYCSVGPWTSRYYYVLGSNDDAHMGFSERIKARIFRYHWRMPTIHHHYCKAWNPGFEYHGGRWSALAKIQFGNRLQYRSKGRRNNTILTSALYFRDPPPPIEKNRFGPQKSKHFWIVGWITIWKLGKPRMPNNYVFSLPSQIRTEDKLAINYYTYAFEVLYIYIYIYIPFTFNFHRVSSFFLLK